LGTNGGGLVVFDPGTHQYRLVGAENGLSNSNILNMAFTRNTVWVSTEGGGVFYSKIQNPLVFQSLNRQIGLSDLNLPVVQADKRGNLWLAGAGLYRIPSAGQNPVGIRSFETMQSGNLLTPQRFQASAISDKGWLALGSNRGFVLFHPDSIGLPARPEVALSGWTTEEKKQALDSALENKRYLIISPENQYFNLRISNLNFFGQDKSQCFYKLEGVHKNWVKAGPSALTEISGLSPGTFQFRFWAGNEQGLKSEEKTIWIKKLPHWYQTLWFYGICIGLFAGLSGLYSHWRINRARKEGFEKAKAEREKLELEVKALRAQMNPHFMFNALNSIDHFIWKNDTLQASDYLARFSRLMRKVLEHSRLEMITLAEEMESLEMYIHLEQLRMESPFGLDIQADTQTPVSEILIPPMCIQPFVENAILHGLLPLSTQGKLCIGFNQIARNQLKVTVEDNGVGRKPEPAPEAADRRSLGMTIIKERIKKIQPFR
jgi:anti-sigma regulatory factor (Ser/Thr protein kinase)